MSDVKTLEDLAQLDVDAVGLYDSAIAHMTVPVLKDQLLQFRADHVRHVGDLNRLIMARGGRAVSFNADTKGKLLKGFTSVTASMGNHAALLAMRGNEELTNHSYSSALDEALDDESRAQVERNFADEQRHLAWIKQAIDLRSWEQPSAPSP